MRGADVLAARLAEFGVDNIFALSGNQIMSVFDACLDTNISIIHTRHEAAAVYMAEGYAQASGKVGVALVTAGAGLASSIAPLLTASASQTPILLISGDSPVDQDGRGAFQEMNQTGITSTVTKGSTRVRDVANLADEVSKMLNLALSGQPGPVHLSLPVDVLKAETPESGPPLTKPTVSPVAPPAPTASPKALSLASSLALSPELSVAPSIQTTTETSADVSVFVDALYQAARPLVLLCPGLSPVRVSLNFEKLNVPAVVMESPRGANDPKLGRFKNLWREADLIISIGKPIDFTLGFGAADVWPKARWMCAFGDNRECERARGNLGSRLVEAVLCEPAEFASSLVSSSHDMPDRTSWCDQVATAIAERSTQPIGSDLTAAYLCSAVQDLLVEAHDPYLICDGGEFGQWAHAIPHTTRRIVNGVSGSIGGGICYAMGAKVAEPLSDVIAMMGDGTVGFHLSEFETAVRANLPFVAVIGNDRRWNAEHLLQQRNYGNDRTHGCELSAARYDKAVEGLGGFGVHVTQAQELPGALLAALHSGRPACVNVDIDGLPAPTLD